MTLWVVGVDQALPSGRTWSLVGIYSAHELAVMACRDRRYFLAPATLNAALPLVGSWPGLYCPNPTEPEETYVRVERTGAGDTATPGTASATADEPVRTAEDESYNPP